jgi:hypothetical protein
MGYENPCTCEDEKDLRDIGWTWGYLDRQTFHDSTHQERIEDLYREAKFTDADPVPEDRGCWT